MPLLGVQCVIAVFPGHTRLITIHSLIGKHVYLRKENDFYRNYFNVYLCVATPWNNSLNCRKHCEFVCNFPQCNVIGKPHQIIVER